MDMTWEGGVLAFIWLFCIFLDWFPLYPLALGVPAPPADHGAKDLLPPPEEASCHLLPTTPWQKAGSLQWCAGVAQEFTPLLFPWACFGGEAEGARWGYITDFSDHEKCSASLEVLGKCVLLKQRAGLHPAHAFLDRPWLTPFRALTCCCGDAAHSRTENSCSFHAAQLTRFISCRRGLLPLRKMHPRSAPSPREWVWTWAAGPGPLPPPTLLWNTWAAELFTVVWFPPPPPLSFCIFHF